MSKIKCVVAKNGKVIMANDRVARKFKSKTTAGRFVHNMIKSSKNMKRRGSAVKLTMKNFEFIAI